MKKFLFVLAIGLLAGTGYFTYDRWVKDSDLTLWSFVPNNAILVYESNQPLTNLEETQTTDIWRNLDYLPVFQRWTESIDILDTLAGQGSFRTFFADSPLLASMHVTASDEFDFLFVLEVRNLQQQTYLSKVLKRLQDQQYNKKTRTYLDFTITEIKSPKGGDSFTYIYYKNFIIGSYSAFLVEDAIRTIDDEASRNFYTDNQVLQRVTKLQKDQGNCYINYNKFTDFLNLFMDTPMQWDMGKSGFLDLDISQDLIRLNGFSFIEDPNDYLSIFQGTGSGPFDMVEIIPNESSSLIHFSGQNPKVIGENLERYFQINAPQILEMRLQIQSKLDFDIGYIFNLIDEEIGLVNLESPITSQPTKMMILEIKDMGEALRFFNAVDERHFKSTGDTTYVEYFGDYQIRRIPTADFPKALLGEIADGFDQAYYIQYRNYLIFSNRVQQLKAMMSGIENEESWGKSRAYNQFLERTNKEANLSLFVNIPRSWEMVMSRLKPSWKEFFSKSKFTFNNFQFFSAQFITVDDKYYTNVVAYQPKLPKNNVPESIEVSQSLTLSDVIRTKPYMVLNHDTKQREIMLQDSSNNLYLINSQFEVLWSKSINEPINSPIKQLDYYKNGKLQYVFTTPSEVHIIDRLGQYLPDFPKERPGEPAIQHFSLIDYDNTKNYRFGIVDIKGNTYLTDKNVKPLDGWNPKEMGQPAVHELEHRRIQGKDFLLLTLTSGKQHLFTRRGSSVPGFPIDLKDNILDAPIIRVANDGSESTITTITESGELIVVNFLGKLIARDQLYKPATLTRFSLIEDVLATQYIILRQTENKYEILDGRGESMFSKDYFTKKSPFTQYYALGGGVSLVVFVDPGGSYLYLYDTKGVLITGSPLTATQPISLFIQEKSYSIYRVVDRNIELVKIKY